MKVGEGAGEELASVAQLAPAHARLRILFLHGILSGRVTWLAVARELAPFADTVTPDLLGHGSAPRRCGDYSLERVVAELHPLVERTGPTHVVGHSMGAIVALALAKEFPGRFEAVGLVAIPIFESRQDGRAFINQRGLLHRALLKTDGLAHVGCVAAHRTRRLWTPLSPLYAPRQPRESLLAAFDHCRDSHAGSLDQVVFGGRVPDLAREVTGQRVAALHGARDRSAPLGRVRALSAEYGWDLRVSPTANHQVHIERPRVVARWVREHVLTSPANPVG